MEVDVDAAVSLELATRADIEKAIRDSNPYNRKIFAGNTGIVPVSGILAFRVYDVPDNYIFTLGKFIAWDDAHNPSSGGVYTNAAAWCGLFHGNPSPVNLAEFWPKPEASTFQIFPYTYEYGDLPAPEFRPPDNIQFQGIGLEVGHNITVIVFGTLKRVKWA